MAEVRLSGISKLYGQMRAVDDLSLTVSEGEFMTLLGPSGCGKTTTLRMVAGFVPPDAGDIRIGGKDVTREPPNRRDTGMVFQSYALFPHLTVADNVGFGLKVRKVAADEVRTRTQKALDLVRMSHLADRLPAQLSGGQQQRVALARAVVIEPQVLLLDEPLGALDLKLRHELQGEIKEVQQRLGITALYVTHDQGEALSLSDRVAVMQEGRIRQLDDPVSVYQRPSSVFVANFVGRTNLVEAEIVSVAPAGCTKLRARLEPAVSFEVDTKAHIPDLQAGSPCLIGFRPEHAGLHAPGGNVLRARVDKVGYYGTSWQVSLTSVLGSAVQVDLGAGDPVPQPGETVDVSWLPRQCFLLPPDVD